MLFIYEYRLFAVVVLCIIEIYFAGRRFVYIAGAK
ncbi:uncharacterized protein METZ01_LOCUS4903 [marine metagenome]|uniref:Uncharacterized protein n=1 Tax=marine metagenome TaxID=408172 RepID=A0A381NC78_9ZZZZ